MMKRPGSLRTRGFPFVTASLCALLAGAAAWGWQSPPTADLHGAMDPALSRTLHILWERVVPAEPSTAMNVRWASDHSVYVARVMHGVSELALDPGLTKLREVVPEPGKMGQRFIDFERLATSPDYLAVSAIGADFAYRPLGQPSDGTFQITKLRLAWVHAFDLSGNRLLLLGDPVPLGSPRPAHGEVGWIGPLSDNPMRDLKPFLYDVAGSPAMSLINCWTLSLGAARFLADGSFMLVPGFQPGVHLYSAEGRLLRTWDNAAVGLDAPDCASMTRADNERFAGSYPARFEFLNQHRVLEDILPLPQGPGLLIRYVAEGRLHWELKILQSGDRVLTFQIPVAGRLPFDRLHGDVRGDRLVLLQTWHGFERGTPPREGRIFLAQLPAPATLREAR
jgi:hypothetical protein